MRVLYVVTLFPCWSETFIVREIHALLARGVDVRILSLKPAHEQLVHADAQVLLNRVIYAPTGLGAARPALAAMLRSPRETLHVLARTVARLLPRPVELAKSLVTCWRTLASATAVADFSPDHIHAHWATYGASAAWLLARTQRVAFSFTAHAHDIFVHDHMLKAKLHDAAFVVAISRFNRDLLLRRFGTESVARVHVVHCGVRPAEFAPDAAAPGDAGADLLSVGRLDPKKGYAVMLDALSELRRRGVLCTAEVIGEGARRPQLEAQRAHLGLESTFALPGAADQPRVRAAMRASRVFVMPCIEAPDGDMDGIPVALMEAMAMGMPVVSTTVSGVPELVIDGETGLLVPPGDPHRLADALQRVLSDAQFAHALGQRARARVESAFDSDREGEKLLALMREAAHHHQGELN